MQYSQKYALVSFISPLETGIKFHMSDWPLHVTLADVFAIDRPGSNIDAKLRELLAANSAVTTTAKEAATLGTAPVVLLEKSDDLVALHNSIVDLLESNGAKFNTPEFTRGGFLPHCTIQKSGRIARGDIVNINEITLVDMFPDGDWQQRKVLNTFKLQNIPGS